MGGPGRRRAGGGRRGARLAPPPLLPLLAAALLAAAGGPRGTAGLKLKVAKEECMLEHVAEGDVLHGSFVSLKGGRGLFGGREKFDLEAKYVHPDGSFDAVAPLLQVFNEDEYRFQKEVPRSGTVKFCLRTSRKNHGDLKDVSWNLKIGHEIKDDKLKDQHLEDIYKQIDGINRIVDEIKSEQGYQRGREARHRKTNDSTSARVHRYAYMEALALVAVSLFQALYIKTMFKQRPSSFLV